MASKDELNRRDFFRNSAKDIGGFLADIFLPDLEDDPNFADPAEPLSYQRPPGAVIEDQFLKYCVDCSDCVEACPRGSIVLADERFPVAVRGTAVISSVIAPCVMCEDIACIDACPTGALYPHEDWKNIRMGTVILTASACLNQTSKDCIRCVDHCPIAKQAIKFDQNNHPVFDTESCTGCGVCVYTCPSEALAIKV